MYEANVVGTSGNYSAGALESGSSFKGTANTPGYYQQLFNGSTIHPKENIVTGFNSWLGNATPGGAYASEFGNRLHFGLVIKSDANHTFTFSDLSFIGHSTDPRNALGQGFSYGTGTYSFGLNVSHGIRYVGQLSDGSYVTTSAYDNTPLIALFGVGSGNAPALYNDPTSGFTNQQVINNALHGIQGPDGSNLIPAAPYNFSGTYTLTGDPSGTQTGSGNVNVSSTPEAGTLSALSTMCLSVIGFAFRRQRVLTS